MTQIVIENIAPTGLLPMDTWANRSNHFEFIELFFNMMILSFQIMMWCGLCKYNLIIKKLLVFINLDQS